MLMYAALGPRVCNLVRQTIINQHNRLSRGMETLPDQCCNLPPFQSDYSPIGRKFKIQVDGQEELEIYSTGQEQSTIALVGIHGKL